MLISGIFGTFSFSRKDACMAFNEIAQVPRMHLQSLERSAVEVAKSLKCDIGMHYDKNSGISKEYVRSFD